MFEYIIHHEDENVIFTSHGDQVEVEAAQYGYLEVAGKNGWVTQPRPRASRTRVDARTGQNRETAVHRQRQQGDTDCWSAQSRQPRQNAEQKVTE